MPNIEIVCEHCQSRYELPDAFREHLRGMTLTCAVCMRQWTPLPADRRGELGAAAGAWAGQPPIALHHYLKSNPYSYAASGAPAGVGTSTLEVAAAPPAPGPTLRVEATGPEFGLRAIFDLGRHSFLIGRRGCHVELPQAAGLPDRAIRIRSADGGFELEAVGSYRIPIGPLSVAAGRLDPGARLELALGGYRVVLEPSGSPGSAIPDLEGAAQPPAPAAAPARPAAAQPAADVNSTARGLSSVGFDIRRYSSPLDDLDVGLLGLDPPVKGQTFWFKKSPTLVGRTSGDLLIADNRVSGKHAQIDVLALDQYAIKDLASTNGTTVNDRPASTTRIKDGDVLGFGGVRLQFVARAKKKG